jgi:hypothetical protein
MASIGSEVRGRDRWVARALGFVGTAAIGAGAIWRESVGLPWPAWLVVVAGAGLIGFLGVENALRWTPQQAKVEARHSTTRFALAFAILIAGGAVAAAFHSLWILLAAVIAAVGAGLVMRLRRHN